jgi:hypothetical protein
MTCIGKEMDDLRSYRARNCVGCTETNLQLTPYAFWVKVGRLHSDLETLQYLIPTEPKLLGLVELPSIQTDNSFKKNRWNVSR